MTDKTETDNGADASGDSPLTDTEELIRMAGEAPEDAEPDAADADEDDGMVDNVTALEMLIGPLLAIMAPGWQVGAEETHQLAEAWAKVADKYFPDGLNLGAELNAAIVTVAILGPKIGRDPKSGEPRSRQHEVKDAPTAPDHPDAFTRNDAAS